MSLRVPKLQHHKATDQARVSIRGRDFYLGKHGSMEANRKYSRIVTAITAGWSGDGDPMEFVNRTNSPGLVPAGTAVILVELVDAYEAAQEKTYPHRTDQAVTLDRQTIATVAEFVLADDAATQVNDLGPKWLKSIRARMVEATKPDGGFRFCRKYINETLIRTIRAMIEFGVSEEMADDRVLVRLRTVKPLKRGEIGEDREGRGVSTVTLVEFHAVVGHLEARGEIQAAGLLRFMLLTGCRTQEARGLTIGDVDRETATATITEHKTSRKTGEAKVLPLSPACMAVIDRAILAHGKRDEDAPVFRSSKRGPFGRAAIRTAVVTACKRLDGAGGSWSPHAIRRLAVSLARGAVSLDAARELAGHAADAQTRDYDRQGREALARQAAEAIERAAVGVA